MGLHEHSATAKNLINRWNASAYVNRCTRVRIQLLNSVDVQDNSRVLLAHRTFAKALVRQCHLVHPVDGHAVMDCFVQPPLQRVCFSFEDLNEVSASPENNSICQVQRDSAMHLVRLRACTYFKSDCLILGYLSMCCAILNISFLNFTGDGRRQFAYAVLQRSPKLGGGNMRACVRACVCGV